MGSGERTERIEEIGGHALDAFGTELPGHVAAHEAYLTGEVDNRDAHAGIALHTAQGEAPGVAADVHQVVDGARKDEVERGIERVVTIIMVEGKPALPHVVGQLGESLVDGGPIAQGGQSGGAPLAQSLFEMEHAAIVHRVVEFEIHARALVGEEKPSGFGEGESVGGLVDQNGADAQRGIGEHRDGIGRKRGGLGDFFDGEPRIAVAQQREDAEFHHEARNFKDNRRPSNEFCAALCLGSRKGFAGVACTEGGKQVHRQRGLEEEGHFSRCDAGPVPNWCRRSRRSCSTPCAHRPFRPAWPCANASLLRRGVPD